MPEKCVGEYLRTRMPGLYCVLALLARSEGARSLSREVVLKLVKRLYGEEVVEYLNRLIEKRALPARARPLLRAPWRAFCKSF